MKETFIHHHIFKSPRNINDNHMFWTRLLSLLFFLSEFKLTPNMKSTTARMKITMICLKLIDFGRKVDCISIYWLLLVWLLPKLSGLLRVSLLLGEVTNLWGIFICVLDRTELISSSMAYNYSIYNLMSIGSFLIASLSRLSRL